MWKSLKEENMGTKNCFCWIYLFIYFETASHSVAQNSFKLQDANDPFASKNKLFIKTEDTKGTCRVG